MNRTQLLAALEGLFYITGDEGLSVEDIASIFAISPEETHDLVESLKDMYDQTIRGLCIIETAGTYKMSTKKEYIDVYKKMYTDLNKSRLTNASLEVLAIIAYKQPITRAEIEDIRGTNSDNIIRRMLSMALIKENGRLEAPGRPIIYGTTNDFLDYFKLASLDELPELIENLDFEEGIEKDLFGKLINMDVN